jgi:hypothetical protein
MRYVGGAGLGGGAVYIGKGRIVGVDAANGRYFGEYSEGNGRMKGSVSLSIPGGGTLVTGQQLPAGQELKLTMDWPSNLADGKPRQLSVSGGTVSVVFEKIGDIP